MTRPLECCGVCPPTSGGGYDCTCTNNRCVELGALAKAVYEAHAVGATWPPSHPADRAYWISLAKSALNHMEGTRND